MNIERITAAYFSPTGNSASLARHLAAEITLLLSGRKTVPPCLDLTLPKLRQEKHVFAEGELLILALPVYAGRLPNKIIPEVKTCLASEGALAIPLVCFGNRDFGDALSELCLTLRELGFRLPAAAALVGEHAFTEKLAAGRPDAEDFSELNAFAEEVSFILGKENFTDVVPAGQNPPGPYYTPLQEDGSPAVFLKAKPLTDPERCTGCGHCAELCPMGSISWENPAELRGICIKCMACVRDCPEAAKYFTDESFLSHVRMLEKHFTRRAENHFFLAEESS